MSRVAATSRDHLLAELGLVRYRLRQPLPASADSIADTAPPVDATVAMPASGATGADQPAPDPGPDMADIRLQVSAGDCAEAPASGPAAAIWAQVLAWAGLRASQVHWHQAAAGTGSDDAVVCLPAPEQWRDPEGKRALWLALKGPVRSVRTWPGR